MPISQKDWDDFLASINTWGSFVGLNRVTAPRQDFLAKNISMRNSVEHAVATMAIFFDVTGSMGSVPQQFVDGALLTLTREIANRGSIPYPEIMFGAVGDVECDSYPLQVTYFNTDIEAAKQLRQLYLEGRGGSNNSESYPAAWLFAARKTMPISLQHGRKGILFTMGDELYPQVISKAHIAQHLGISNSHTVQSTRRSFASDALSAANRPVSSAMTLYAPYTPGSTVTRRTHTPDVLTAALVANNSVSSLVRRTHTPATALSANNSVSSLTSYIPGFSSVKSMIGISEAVEITTREILEEAQKKYEIFHLVLKADQNPSTFNAWKELLGDKAIPVNEEDMDKVAEIIVSTIDRYYSRMTQTQVALSWESPAVRRAVKKSIANLSTLAIVEHPSIGNSNAVPKSRIQDGSAQKFLTDNGFSTEESRINNSISNGYTPLTLAVTNGDYTTSYTLVTNNHADVNAQGLNGDAALHIALRNYNQPNAAYRDMTTWLVTAGANLDLANRQGITPRKLARELDINIQGLLEDAADAAANKEESWCMETCFLC